jgi:hypothetical protein
MEKTKLQQMYESSARLELASQIMFEIIRKTNHPALKNIPEIAYNMAGILLNSAEGKSTKELSEIKPTETKTPTQSETKNVKPYNNTKVYDVGDRFLYKGIVCEVTQVTKVEEGTSCNACVMKGSDDCFFSNINPITDRFTCNSVYRYDEK